MKEKQFFKRRPHFEKQKKEKEKRKRVAVDLNADLLKEQVSQSVRWKYVQSVIGISPRYDLPARRLGRFGKT